MDENLKNDSQEVQPDTNEQETDTPSESKEENGEVTKLKEELAKKDEQIANLSKAKRELKKEVKKSDSSEEYKKSDGEFGLLQETYLATQGIEEEDEIELAKKLQKETGKELVELIKGKYFKSELQELRDEKANTKATSGVEGGGGESSATNKAAYWIAKGVPPTREQVPDNKTRRAIAKAFVAAGKSGGKTFYND